MSSVRAPGTLLPMDRASVFYDGIFAEPVRLAHAEGVAVHEDGSVWCGTENGDLLRIEPDGSSMSCQGSTGGWIAGIAFAEGALYACDIRYGGVFRLDLQSKVLKRFAEARLAIPNYPVVDLKRRRLYVSDSCGYEAPGPGVWAFDLDTAQAHLWYDRPLSFANGMALAPDGTSLYVVESLPKRVVRVPILRDGTAGNAEPVVGGLVEFPDGIAFDTAGNLYISCYEPSQIYRFDTQGKLELLIRDPVATLLSHPTNMAFRGKTMFTSNLGRWHITQIALDVEGSPVPLPVSHFA
ncbi:MAG: SMP-30/gluconolactonase/LRE family protein [Gammaproteobacteria bacterium]